MKIYIRQGEAGAYIYAPGMLFRELYGERGMEVRILLHM